MPWRWRFAALSLLPVLTAVAGIRVQAADSPLCNVAAPATAGLSNIQCMSWRNPTWCDDEQLLAGVEHPAEVDGYTAAERVALEYAERFCTDSINIDDALIDRLKQHFDSAGIVDLTLVIGKYLALGRFTQVLGLDQACLMHFDEDGTLTYS